VVKYDGLTGSPVLEEDRCAVFDFDRVHVGSFKDYGHRR
jgi:hypothetical protein